MAEWLRSKDMTAGQRVDMPPVWLVGFIVLVWVQVRLWPGATAPQLLSRFAGILLFIGGLALMVWALWTFRRHATTVVPHQTPERIITKGPFARSRNPIYLGDVLVLTGGILWYGAWPSLLLIPLFVTILIRRFIAPEEARMKQCFGSEYAEFARKTPRWI
ncbi:MAG: isoprenylcysteine carboxylmethyltransferase family protein [Sulfitobacter sp.]